MCDVIRFPRTDHERETYRRLRDYGATVEAALAGAAGEDQVETVSACACCGLEIRARQLVYWDKDYPQEVCCSQGCFGMMVAVREVER